jgi:fructose/tagatose bisphosphate aldolase
MGSSNVHNEDIDYEEVRRYMTKPEQAADFVAKTGIDTFAAQVGNLHGRYPAPKQLDLELLQRIRGALIATLVYMAAATRQGTTSERLRKLV